MRVLAVIQARTGSTRFPGKVLKDIAGRTMLARVVRRTQRSALINNIVVATTSEKADDTIVKECETLGVSYFRGSEMDVLDRYYQAAKAFSADSVVRITSDCPFIDAEIIDKVIQAFLDESPDYASNTQVSSYPRGLDVEVFSVEALEMAWQAASEDYQHVHVTPYIYQHPELFRLLSVKGEEDFSCYRWTVDTQEDLDLARAIYKRIDRDDEFSWREVLALFEREPELAEINKHIRQKSLEEC
ncbi:MAG: glycosyltransferase family protein [Methanotrichaceae archaeon]|nr:glycosyltransferase family protein [Methanotrichaceae archaeon]MDD1757525.1 glycosyltransferase family protein [Methanotrichaceae archaeon]